jgi:hypothetical protein
MAVINMVLTTPAYSILNYILYYNIYIIYAKITLLDLEFRMLE